MKSPANCSMFTDLITQMLGEKIKSCNSSSIKRCPTRASILNVPIQTIGGDMLKKRCNIYELTTETHKDLSSTGYTGITMENDSDFFKG